MWFILVRAKRFNVAGSIPKICGTLLRVTLTFGAPKRVRRLAAKHFE